MSRGVLQLVAAAIFLLQAAIFARAIISWLPVSPQNPLRVLLETLTEPILRPLRRVVPRLGMFDITPMVALVVLFVVGQAVNVALVGA
jgi:YggT family protein